MGYDISYHPVDIQYLESTVFPYILGETDSDALFDRPTKIVQARFQANAWGLGLLGRYHEQNRREYEWNSQNAIKKAALKLAGKKPPERELEFESDIYVWGRPFFISDASAAEVAASIERYLNATDLAAVDALAQQAINDKWPQLAGAIQPKFEQEPPTESDFRNEVSWKIVLMRDAVAALRAGTEVKTPDGESMDPAECIEAYLQHAAMEFAAITRPGWMTRGYVWPTYLCDLGGLPTTVFESSQKPFSGFLEKLPEAKLRDDDAISENYMLGGYVPAAELPQLKQLFAEGRDEIIAAATKEGWEYDCKVTLQKLDETIHYCEVNNLGLVEAAEIYSGPMGIMN
ncbi:MAG: hypothetical protein AAGC71_03805 [Pseudomonadota bacterium]